VPASFVSKMLGLREAVPNFADGDSAQSVAIAAEVLSQLGVSGQGPAKGQTSGRMLEEGVESYLATALPAAGSWRTWDVRRGRSITEFSQYAHLEKLEELVRRDDTDTLRSELGGDYLVKPDVTVGIVKDGEIPFLHAAISCKFTIRSDRVQNIRHEGVIMTRHRRGRQPHIVTVTSEPLPTRLAAIARGTGEVDAVYHVCLPELAAAADAVGNDEQRRTLDEMVNQSRLFDLAVLPDHLTL